MRPATVTPDPHVEPPDELALGLTSAEAVARLAEVGPNELPTTEPEPLWARVARQLREPMALLLAAAAAVSWAGLGETESGIAILAIVVLNATIGVLQEGKAERAMAALLELEAPEARAVRDGRTVLVPARTLVPGDVVVLTAGDRVPADVRLVQADAMQVDEAILTGESLPVSKSAGAEGLDGAAMSGTLVTRGRGRALVAATGPATELGGIAAGLRSGQGQTPLQRELTNLTARLGTIALVVAAGVFCLTLLRVGVSHDGLQTSFLTAVALAVAAVPEGLATVVTVGLALGVARMAGEGAIIRRLPAVETLGSATVILTDKTGTLTRNRMRLDAALIPGLSPVPVARLPEDARLRILEVAALCNDADLDPPSGDPIEVALLEAFEASAVERTRRSAPRITSMPFSEERRRMTTVHRSPTGQVVLEKGAPEVVLSRCARILDANGNPAPASDALWRELRESASAMAHQGMRVLALARGEDRGDPDAGDLDLVALVGLRDPARPEAPGAVAEARAAGIEIVMVTGDHPGTASAIAAEVGLATNGDVLTGDDLAGGPPEDPLEASRVYARARPGDKLALVEALQRRGHVVAVTGDGVNDAPALQRADIGVAMGRSGSDVAREASDMVVTDDNLATIVTAVREGRGIYENIRKVVDYLVAGNLSEILVVVVALAAFPGLGVPLLPLQLLWVNLLTDGLPAVALGVDPVDPSLMRRRPRDRAARMLSVSRVGRLLGRGALIATAAVSSLAVARFAFHESWEHARAVMFTVLIGAHLLYAFVVSGGIRRRWLAPAVGAGLALQSLILLWPAARHLFSTASLSAREWILVGVAAIAPIAAMVGPGWVRHRRRA